MLGDFFTYVFFQREGNGKFENFREICWLVRFDIIWPCAFSRFFSSIPPKFDDVKTFPPGFFWAEKNAPPRLAGP